MSSMSARGRGFRATATSLFTLTAAMVGDAAWAQSATPSPNASDESVSVEGLVVTARKREEQVIDVPFSVQVVTSESLERLGAVNFGDYARTVAGVQFQDKGAGRATIFMRGVSTGGDVDTGKQSTVGLYFDETPIAESSSQPDIKLFDINRVEVLRGPQGTLFGSGSLSGTLRVLPRAPVVGDTQGFLQGQVSATEQGGLNESTNGMVNLPIGDNAALRVVAYGIHNEGFLTNGFTGEDNVNDEDTYGGRAALLVQVNDRLDATLSGVFQFSNFGEYYQLTDHYPDLVIDGAEPGPFKDRYAIGQLKINYDFGRSLLTSVTGYYGRNRYFENDVDFFTAFFGMPQAFSPLTYTSKAFTQEVRLASTGEQRFDWVVGAFFQDVRENATQSISAKGQPVPPPAAQLANIYRDTSNRQYALFGEGSYDITPELTFTAGLRISLIQGENTSINNGILFGGETIKRGENEDSPITPRFILSWRPTENTQIYAQASRGFRIGGVNPGLPPCNPAMGCTVDVGSGFGPDSVWNYELGTKLQLLDGRLLLDADIFYIDWTDIQVNVGRGDGFNGFLNAGSATTKGFELAGTAQLTHNFRAGGQFTYTEAYLTGLAPGVAEAGVAEVGDDLPQIPRTSASVFGEWGTEIGSASWVYLRGDLQYVATRYGDFTSNNPLELPSYVLVNFRAGLDRGPYSAAVFVTNATDKRAIFSEQHYSGLHNDLPYSWQRYNINPPRTIGVSLSRRF